MIVRLLLQVPPRGLSARNDCLQGNRFVVFDEGHEVQVIVTLDDEDPLSAISLLVRVFQDVQRVSLSDEEHDLFEPDAAVGLQLLVPGLCSAGGASSSARSFGLDWTVALRRSSASALARVATSCWLQSLASTQLGSAFRFRLERRRVIHRCCILALSTASLVFAE